MEEMIIRKDNIRLDADFPFNWSQKKLPPGYNMGRVYHWHECLEISYVKSGHGRYCFGGRTLEMAPGDIIIINNVEPHYLEVDEEEMEQPVMIFQPSFVWSFGNTPMDVDYLRPFFERGTDFCNRLDPSHPGTKEIQEHIAIIEKEWREKAEGFRMMIKARLLLILTCLSRYFRKSGSCSEENNDRRFLVRLDEVLRLVSDRYAEDIRLTDAASKLHVTPQYFSAMFRKAMGMTFIEYLNNIRINHAIKLLGETDQKIIHIANKCGFNNTAHFNSVFKKFTGKNPSEFRFCTYDTSGCRSVTGV